MKLADIFVESSVVVSIKGVTKSEAIRELAGALRRTRRIPKEHEETIVRALEQREALGSTGIGRGVGVPHIKHPSVARIVGAFGRSESGIEYQALDGDPVFLVFLLVSPVDATTEHLEALRRIAALAKDADLRRFLRGIRTAAEATDLMREADEKYQA
jgi:mannitol/fructose-specific phosphotransferase system IIA component (Ntr-type)